MNKKILDAYCKAKKRCPKIAEMFEEKHADLEMLEVCGLFCDYYDDPLEETNNLLVACQRPLREHYAISREEIDVMMMTTCSYYIGNVKEEVSVKELDHE